MRYTVIGIFFISLFGCTQDIQEPTSEIWKEFVNSVENPGTDSRLIDFSYAGYDFGESDLPENNQPNYFIVTDFGALADDDISDFDAIQKAIDAAEEAGGGCVFFPPGRFLLNEEKNCQQSLLVRSSNIILKGSGDEAGGTELFMKEYLVPDDPSRMWTTPPMIQFIGDKKEIAINSKLKSNVSRGASTLEFESVSNLVAGDFILINAQGTFLNAQMLEGRKTREIWEDINVLGAEVVELHQVKEVDGNVVRLRAPVLVNIDRNEAWKIVKYNLISNCGFENIHFIGNFHDEYVHHKDARHDSGWTGLRMTRCFNSWVRNCSFTNVSSGASLKMSLASVILRCKTEGNMGHEGFTTSTSTRCMIAYCEDNAPEFHGPCSSHAAVGCVILRFKGINTGFDLHASFPRYTLFDQCEMAGLDNHGGNYKDLPNHLQGLVLWNFKQTANPEPGFNFWDLLEDTPDKIYGPLTVVNPVIVGYHGIPMSFDEESLGYLESLGEAVTPGSLYIEQLKLRGFDIPVYLSESSE